MASMVGEIVGHYRILEKLGGGGMGIIYKALDIKLDRHVALKFLPPVFSMNEDSKQIIINEAKIAATLDHPNICTIHEVGETEEDQIFIAMSYYEGESLKKRIKKGDLKQNEIENIIKQTARGLLAAHEKGIVHRDIKPDNIFITKSGDVKILDFGVAKVEGDYSVRDAEKITGTISYMSPEQITGQKTDHRSDIWSFGVLIYELVTGLKPFGNQYEQSTMYSILNDDPDLSLLKELDIPPYLKEIVQICLEKKIENRINSISDVLSIFEGEEIATKGKKSKVKLFSLIFSALIIVIIVSILFNLYTPLISIFSPKSKTQNKIAILPFNYSENIDTNNKMNLLLQNLIANYLMNTEQVVIVDPMSLNGYIGDISNLIVLDEINEITSLLKEIDVDYYLNGSLQFSKDKYFVVGNFVETSTKQINFSINESFNIEDETVQIAEIISNKIFDFFQIKKLSKSDDESIHPFMMGTKNISALKTFLLASEHMYRMERVEAKKYLYQSIELDSTFLCPRVWLISYLFSEGNYEEAETHLNIAKGYEYKANIMEKILINWAEARLNDDIYGRIRCLKMGLEYSPQNNIILYQLGYNYYTLKNYSTALKYLEPVVEMKWTFSPAYYVTGYCLMKQSKFERAIQILERSLVHEPIYEMTYLLLKLAYQQIGDSDQADYYEKLCESHWTSVGISGVEGLNVSAELYQDFNLFHESISDYQQVLYHEPNNIEVIEKIGDLYLAVKDTNASIDRYQSALQYDNLIPSVNLKLGRIYDSRHDNLQALKHYNNFIQKDTSEIKSQINLRIQQLNNY